MILNAENVDSLLDFVSRIDDMIYRKATGTPAELAEKLGVSERSLYRFIRKMKCLNLPIAYDKHKRTYYYTQAGRLQIKFETVE